MFICAAGKTHELPLQQPAHVLALHTLPPKQVPALQVWPAC
jgi:hypothetical protein